MAVKILAFAASNREGSYNRQLLPILVNSARAAGAEVHVADLREYVLPVYDANLEANEGLPVAAQKLQQLMAAHQGLLVVTPEYNGSIPPLLKNTLDWMSRPDSTKQSGLRHFKGKAAALSTASPGALGGARSLLISRQLLSQLGFLVIPQALALAHADQAFGPDGRIKEAWQQASAESVGAALAALLGKLQP